MGRRFCKSFTVTGPRTVEIFSTDAGDYNEAVLLGMSRGDMDKLYETITGKPAPVGNISKPQRASRLISLAVACATGNDKPKPVEKDEPEEPAAPTKPSKPAKEPKPKREPKPKPDKPKHDANSGPRPGTMKAQMLDYARTRGATLAGAAKHSGWAPASVRSAYGADYRRWGIVVKADDDGNLIVGKA